MYAYRKPPYSRKRNVCSNGNFYSLQMYHALAKHGGMSLKMKCQGDLWIDDHHTADTLRNPLHSIWKYDINETDDRPILYRIAL